MTTERDDFDNLELKPLEEENQADNEVVTLSDTVDWPMLCRVATPDVYRQNPCRMTQSAGLLASAAPIEVEIRQAARKDLADPEHRALAEFFWFWQEPGSTIPDDVNAALQLWQSQKDEPGPQRAVALHNLAILYHYLALDLEHRALDHPLDAGQARTLATCWPAAWESWRAFFDDPDAWEDRREQLRTAAIPRVRQASQPQIVASLIQALCHLNMYLALRYVASEKPKEVRRLLEVVEAAGWPDWFHDDTLRFLTDSLKKHIDQKCTDCLNRSKANPEHADREALALKTAVKPFLLVVDQLLPEKNLLRRQAHDTVALQMLDCVERFGLAKDNWQETLRVMTRIYRQGISEATSERIDRCLHEIQEKAGTIDGWCDYGYFELPAKALEVLEAAQRDAKKKQYEYAIAGLEKLLAAWKPVAPLADPLLVRKPLAYCLDRRAIPRLQAAWKETCEDLPVFEDADPEALQQGIDRAQDMYAPGRYTCSVCAAAIHEDRFIKIRYRGHRVMLCLRCGEKGQKQLAKKNRWLQEEYMAVRDELLKAKKLDPENNVIDDHLLKAEQAMTQMEA